jgi:hypothetical protein
LFFLAIYGIYFFRSQPRSPTARTRIVGPGDLPIRVGPNNNSRPYPTKECNVDFVEYVSSEYESLWERNAPKPDWGRTPCQHANDPGVPELLEKWISYTKNSFSQTVTPNDLGEPFSHFKYRDCEGKITNVPIEPFALVGRHPRLCTNFNALLSKEYLFINSHIHGTSGRNYYFDLGASTWTTGGGGASQKFIYEVYSGFDIKFDGIYAWEATPMDNATTWSEIPVEVQPYYHWFNVPANPTIGHADNPLRIMKEVVKPNDFLVFKLDIDNAEVEDKFIAQIMSDPSLSSLIDEMFFEHHINMEPLASCCWVMTESNITMVDSAKIFLGLRRKGIRMHVWV